jgi:hypothetical protein
MKLSREDLYVIGGYVAFIALFWFLGASPKMTKFEAFFGLAALTGVYAVAVRIVKKFVGR